MKINKKDLLNNAEFKQLMTLVRDRQESGHYYGNKEQYEKRERKIINKLIKLAGIHNVVCSK